VTTIKSMITGAYSRSEALVNATRDYDRGRIEPIELEQYYKDDLRQLITCQEHNNIDYISDGLLTWQDDFRPFVEACSGIESGPLTRYFNTNTFYRRPVFKDNQALTLDALADHYFTDKKVRADIITVPGIASLIEMSQSTADSLDSAITMLKKAINELAHEDCKLILVKEPWLAYNSDNVSTVMLAGYCAAIQQIVEYAKAINSTLQVGLHLPFGNAAPLLDKIMQLPLDCIGIDFFETAADDVNAFNWHNKVLIAGCINGRNSLIEDPEVTSEFVKNLAAKLEPSEIFISNSVDLRFVPEAIARQKVKVMGDVKALCKA